MCVVLHHSLHADTSKEAEEWMQAFSNELKQAEKEFGDAMHQFSGGNPDVTAQLAEMMQVRLYCTLAVRDCSGEEGCI